MSKNKGTLLLRLLQTFLKRENLILFTFYALTKQTFLLR
jgi:hypothetical protein